MKIPVLANWINFVKHESLRFFKKFILTAFSIGFFLEFLTLYKNKSPVLIYFPL